MFLFTFLPPLCSSVHTILFLVTEGAPYKILLHFSMYSSEHVTPKWSHNFCSVSFGLSIVSCPGISITASPNLSLTRWPAFVRLN